MSYNIYAAFLSLLAIVAVAMGAWAYSLGAYAEAMVGAVTAILISAMVLAEWMREIE